MKNKLIFVLFGFMFVLLISSSIVLAWYSDRDDVNLILSNPSYDEIEFVTSFGEEYIDENGIIIIDGVESGADKVTITDLTVKVKFTPKITSYLRISINDVWKLKRTYDNQKVTEQYISVENQIRYNLAENWVYDPITRYFYYINIIPKSSETLEIDFITSGIGMEETSSLRYTDEYTVRIDFSADVVQANRIEEVWFVSINSGVVKNIEKEDANA